MEWIIPKCFLTQNQARTKFKKYQKQLFSFYLLDNVMSDANSRNHSVTR